jgi:hypothetical protein
MSTRNRLALLAALPFALGFSGCGGNSAGSGKNPDSGPPGSPDAPVPDSAEQPVGAASITVSTASVDLGMFDVGMPSAPVLVTVTNTGTATTGPLALLVTGDAVVANGCEGATLAPQATCTITIIARSPVGGPISGTVDVGDWTAEVKRISVTGIATHPGGGVLITPSWLDLGRVLPGRTVTKTIVLTNQTVADLLGMVISISSPSYSLSPTGTCTGTLLIQQSCNIDVTFTAGRTLGPAEGFVTISQGGITKFVPVTATVYSIPEWPLTPRSASLQTVVGTPSSPVTFFVPRGDGSGPIPTATITGTNARDFSFTTDCDQPLVGDAPYSCQVNVVYNPATAPATNSTATLTVAIGEAVASAALTGTAFSPSPPKIIGTAFDFGTVVVGSTSKELTFTITNNGGKDLAGDGIEISTSIGQFVVATDNCTGKDLPVQGQCTFTVQFKPVAGDQGVLSGQLKAKFCTDPCYPSYAGVTGTAVPPAKLALTPTPLEFGTLPVLQESVPLTLIVSNIGGLPTGSLKVDKTGAAFAIKSDTCTGATLTATGVSSSCTIALTYTPAAQPAEATGSITISDPSGAAAAPVTATLHGKGEPHPTLLRQIKRGYR